MTMPLKPSTVDEYVLQLSEPARGYAERVRALILKAEPHAEERLSYGMPYYGFHGRLVYWGAFKEHLGLYVMAAARDALTKEIEPYRQSKATLHFSFDKPLPAELITRIVTVQAAANMRSET